jgi:O-antigen/teichoic acid export membrane protein
LVAVGLGVTGILFTYMLPVLIVALVFYFALPRLAHFAGTIPAVNRPLLYELLCYSLSTQVFNIIWSVPAIVFPLLTLAWLGAQASAMLALSWYAYTFLAIIPNSITVALLVDGAHDPKEFSHRLWHALLINLAILLPLVICIVVIAPWLLGFFGNSYVGATLLLRLLTISTLPLSINGLYMTLWRVRKQTFHINLFALFLVLGTIILAGMLTFVFGLDGIGWGWLAGQILFALASMTLIVRTRWMAQPEIG